jgi:hypothetical protein
MDLSRANAVWFVILASCILGVWIASIKSPAVLPFSFLEWTTFELEFVTPGDFIVTDSDATATYN